MKKRFILNINTINQHEWHPFSIENNIDTTRGEVSPSSAAEGEGTWKHNVSSKEANPLHGGDRTVIYFEWLLFSPLCDANYLHLFIYCVQNVVWRRLALIDRTNRAIHRWCLHVFMNSINHSLLHWWEIELEIKYYVDLMRHGMVFVTLSWKNQVTSSCST